MFSDNLSNHALKIVEENNFSYETAAELCDMSTRHFGNIVRRHAVPSVNMLERMCKGFGVTPNELLLSEPVELSAKQQPMKVSMEKVRLDSGITAYYPVCPGCGEAPGREFQYYCGRCGQSLDWSDFGAVLGSGQGLELGTMLH